MTSTAPPLADAARGASATLTLLLAAACGLIVANLYYAQPLAGPIGASLGLSPGATGLIVTLTQIGYGIGLLFIVPLGDLVETRRLVLGLVALVTLALVGAALSTSPVPFLAAVLAIGLVSVAAQVLVPYAAHLAPPEHRGRMVGNVMSGLLMGIMLARPVASFIAQAGSWHTVFWLSAVAMAALAVLLGVALPRRQPAAALPYRRLLASMAHLARSSLVLRRRALYHAAMFGAFSVFWTTAPLRLAHEFGLSQTGIALFALAGVAGAIASPIAGRLADAGHGRAATVLAMGCAIAAFVLSRAGAPGSTTALAAMVAAGIVLDFGVTTNLVVGQRAIFTLGDDVRSRLNGLYMATFFGGGAIGSAFGGLAFAQAGWTGAAWLGATLPAAALAYAATEATAYR
ncbi:MAG TPA: MFS transporter [Burkholderiaceae bacterium]